MEAQGIYFLTRREGRPDMMRDNRQRNDMDYRSESLPPPKRQRIFEAQLSSTVDAVKRRRFSKFILTIIACLYFTSQVQSVGSTTGYRVEGRLTKEMLFYNKSRQDSTNEFTFECSVIANKWLIILKSINGTYDSFSAGCEGLNIYSLIDFSSQVSKKKLQGEKTGNNIAVGIIIPGTAPVELSEPAIATIWLAFASDQSLRQLESSRLPRLNPSGNISPFSLKATEKCVFTRAADSISSVRELTAFSDGTYEYWGQAGPTLAAWAKDPTLVKLPKPYDQGFTNCVFKTIDGNDRFDKKLITSEFTMVRYGINPGGTNSSDLRINNRTHGLVTSIRIISEPFVSLPVIPGLTLCADYRLSLGSNAIPGSMDYFFKSNWKPLQEIESTPKLTSIKEERKRVARILSEAESYSAGTQYGRLTFALLIATTTLLVWWVVKKQYKTEKK